MKARDIHAYNEQK